MSSLQKIINLVKKTGEKAIILDENGELSFVIMPFSDYEELVAEADFLPEISHNDDDWGNWWEEKDRDLPFGPVDFPSDLTENDDNKPDWPGGVEPDFSSLAEPETPVLPESFSQNKEKNEDDPLYFETVE